MTNNMVTASTLSADWLSNHTQVSADSDIDQELLMHYTFKSSLKGNYSCPLNGSMEKCLDIGFSSGVWMMEMSCEFPECEFFGIDPKPRSPDLVYPPNCLFREGDFLKPLPYPDNTFDLVHVRMILFTLSPDQRNVLLGEISRVTKKGGFVEFLEPSLSSGSNIGGPLLNKLMFILTETINSAPMDEFYDKSLAEWGFLNPVNDKVSIPLGKWGSMIGDFSLAALKLFISNTNFMRSKLNLHDEKELQNFLTSVERECEQFKPQVDVCSGFAQKL